MCKIEFLEWDSSFFKRKIGRIQADICSQSELHEICNSAQTQSYDVIYVFGDENFRIEENLLEQYSGELVDTKVLFHTELNKEKEVKNEISELQSSEVSEELLSLALLSGQHSRFRKHGFSERDFEQMYTEWISASVEKRIADKVFVTYHNGLVSGFVTLNIKEKQGEIGLIAVSEQQQGKGIGKDLILGSMNYLFSKNINELYVPTQKTNKQACNFYKKMGFIENQVQNIYHFLLK